MDRMPRRPVGYIERGLLAKGGLLGWPNVRSLIVLRLVVGRGMALMFGGVVLGLAASLVLSRFLESLLFEVGARDPVTFVLVPVGLAIVALVACYIPARRAARVDPIVALRYE